MPTISIITTTYKHQDFIEETIQSILNQTFSDWELLIGDDSPDDKTWNIIQKYVKKYPNKIKAWHHKPNKGIVDNMNFLLSKASPDSKYIAFLEGDDLYTPDNLEEKIKIFEKYPEIIAVISDFKKIDSNGNEIKDNFITQIGKVFSLGKKLKKGINNLGFKEFIVSFLNNPIQSFGCVMLKKDKLFKHLPLTNLDKNNKMFGPLDYYLWINLFSNENIYFLDKPLFKYRIHLNNFSGNKNIEIMTKQRDLIFEYLNKKTNYIYDKEIKFKIAILYGIQHIIQGNKKEGLKKIYETFKYFKIKYLSYRFKMIIRLLIPNLIIKKITNVK